MLHKIFDHNPSPESIERVIRWLQEGKIIIYPTGISYALGCLASKQRAIEEICKIKGVDPKKKTLAVVCGDIAQAAEYTHIDNETFSLLKNGEYEPATYLLPAGNKFPNIIKNRKEIGVRLCSHSAMKHILEALGMPLITGSLPYDPDIDVSYFTHPELIDEKFGHWVVAVLDGGIASGGQTAVIDCRSDGAPEIIRTAQISD